MYELLKTLTGARDAVVSLSFSSDGKYVAAVGYGGVAVWELQTFTLLSGPCLPYNPRNPTNVYTACAWLHFEHADRYFLVAGSQQGALCLFNYDHGGKLYKQLDPLHSGSQVLSIDVYQEKIPTGRLARVAVATADNRVSVYSLSSSGDLQEIYSTDVEFRLIAARFCKRTRDVYAFRMTGGGIIRLDDKTGDLKSHQRFGPDPIGAVCMDPSGKYFAACTGKDFEMFCLSPVEPVKTFEGDPPIVLYPKVVAYAEDGAILIGGTDNGCAVIYDTKTGNRLQKLPYTRGGLVQPVAACKTAQNFLLAIAGSTSENPADVILYVKRRVHTASTSKHINKGATQSSSAELLKMIGLSMMVYATCSLAFKCIPWVWSLVSTVISLAIGEMIVP